MGYPRKNPNRWGLRIGHEISRGIEDRACENSRVELKKEVELLGVLRKNSCRISMGFSFGPYNFHRVLHNFAEFPVVGWQW